MYDFLWDKNKNFWLATNQGPYLLHEATGKLTSFQPFATARQLLVPIRKIMLDGSENLWLASQDRGLFVLDQRLKIVRRYSHRENDPSSLGSDNVTSLLLDNQKNI